MKNFIIYALLILLGTMTVLEVVTRIFNLSADTMPETNLNGNKLLSPNTEGLWVRGGLGELKNHYKINAQGFNSTKDYNLIDTSKINIAIIGDSYIEGLHVDVENSIGRIIERKTRNNVEVHEFGHSGGNIMDFSIIFEKWVKGKYDYAFILLTDNDITDKKPSFMGKGAKVVKSSFTRNLYDNCYSIRYLNINHGMSVKFTKILSFDNFKRDKKEKEMNEKDVNLKAFSLLDETVTILHERDRLNTSLLEKTNLKTLKVDHKLTPIDCGFDGHWGLNGRMNAANSIVEFLQQKHSNIK